MSRNAIIYLLWYKYVDDKHIYVHAYSSGFYPIVGFWAFPTIVLFTVLQEMVNNAIILWEDEDELLGVATHGL